MSGHTAILVFTRFPLSGQAKTRLIPALGPEGAAELQRRMTLVTVGRAWSFCAANAPARLVIHYEGGDATLMRHWLGPLEYLPQGQGSLGDRLRRAASQAFEAGAARVIVIGTDCPALKEEHLAAAVAATQHHPIVFGPAGDGGYYLVALTDAGHTAVFDNIPWSTPEVLALSCQAARAAGHEPFLLTSLSDVDEPEDLPAAEAALKESETLSIIVPALNEAPNLSRLLPVLKAAAPHEIIVADGGSVDDTPAVAAQFGAQFLPAGKGRALQMNTAAARATGEFLLFLHADTLPPTGFPDIIRKSLMRPGISAGAFKFKLDGPFAGRRLVETLVALRCHCWSLPYGDQGLFLRRRLFMDSGGFPDWPIMEDVALVRRLRGMGRILITPEAAPTSSRRWQSGGVVRTFLKHQRILAGFALGIPPARLAKWR